ncbi:hypothetical protein [Clostridium botulinum]|uniref:hypothetical protein n=1 Tax=Clostridium botulinum TaxID=1491 RepID=UPI0012B43994|nr:hypothetical protein [Clostridium botulinum]
MQKEIAKRAKKDSTTISKEIKCNSSCGKQCTKLNRYPYVCNSCNTVTTCTGEKRVIIKLKLQMQSIRNYWKYM